MFKVYLHCIRGLELFLNIFRFTIESLLLVAITVIYSASKETLLAIFVIFGPKTTFYVWVKIGSLVFFIFCMKLDGIEGYKLP